jgi:hypothetical protein
MQRVSARIETRKISFTHNQPETHCKSYFPGYTLTQPSSHHELTAFAVSDPRHLGSPPATNLRAVSTGFLSRHRILPRPVMVYATRLPLKISA